MQKLLVVSNCECAAVFLMYMYIYVNTHEFVTHMRLGVSSAQHPLGAVKEIGFRS